MSKIFVPSCLLSFSKYFYSPVWISWPQQVKTAKHRVQWQGGELGVTSQLEHQGRPWGGGSTATQPRRPPGNPAEPDIRYGTSECDEGRRLPRYEAICLSDRRLFPSMRWNQIRQCQQSAKCFESKVPTSPDHPGEAFPCSSMLKSCPGSPLEPKPSQSVQFHEKKGVSSHFLITSQLLIIHWFRASTATQSN